MDITKFDLGAWTEKFKPFIESPEMDAIYSKLKADAKMNKQILPKSSNTFEVFKRVPPDKLRVVFYLQDPYATMKDGVVIASGIALDCSNVAPSLQPSLTNFYEEIERTVHGGMCLHCEKPASLQYLLDQGVMLINSDLTCELNKSGSHTGLWEPFMKYFIEEILNKEHRGLIFILSGKSSQRLEKYILPMVHYVFKTTHPASASYKGDTWNSEDVFNKVNNLIEQNNGKEFRIEWMPEPAPF